MAALINPSPDVLDSDLKLYRYCNMRGIIEASSNSIVADMLGKKTSYITAIAGPNGDCCTALLAVQLFLFTVLAYR